MFIFKAVYPHCLALAVKCSRTINRSLEEKPVITMKRPFKMWLVVDITSIVFDGNVSQNCPTHGQAELVFISNVFLINKTS